MEVLQTHIKKTRKPHMCEFCLRTINPGEGATKTFIKDGGDAYSIFLCEWCAENYWNVTDEPEFFTGDLREHVRGRLNYTCPKCGNDDYDDELHTERNAALLKCCNGECGHEWEIKLTDLFGV